MRKSTPSFLLFGWEKNLKKRKGFFHIFSIFFFRSKCVKNNKKNYWNEENGQPGEGVILATVKNLTWLRHYTPRTRKRERRPRWEKRNDGWHLDKTPALLLVSSSATNLADTHHFSASSSSSSSSCVQMVQLHTDPFKKRHISNHFSNIDWMRNQIIPAERQLRFTLIQSYSN